MKEHCLWTPDVSLLAGGHELVQHPASFSLYFILWMSLLFVFTFAGHPFPFNRTCLVNLGGGLRHIELHPFHSPSLWSSMPLLLQAPALPSGKASGFQPSLTDGWVCLIPWCSTRHTLLLNIEATFSHNNLKNKNGDIFTPVHLTLWCYFSNGSRNTWAGRDGCKLSSVQIIASIF